MADLLILALTVFTFKNNTKIAINIHLLEIFALLLVFSYQFTANCLSLPPPLLGGAISKPLTLPFALAFRTSNIETVVRIWGFIYGGHQIMVRWFNLTRGSICHLLT